MSEAMRLADKYAEATFDQGLHQRTEDPAPEARRGELAAEIRKREAEFTACYSSLTSQEEKNAALQAECEQLRNENAALLDSLWKSSGDDKETVECYLRSVGLKSETLYSKRSAK